MDDSELDRLFGKEDESSGETLKEDDKVSDKLSDDKAENDVKEKKPKEKSLKKPKEKPEEKSAWQLQLGAFGVKSNADLLVDNLKKRNISCTITQNTLESGKVLYIVRTGPFDTKENAVDYGAKKLAPLNVEFRPTLVKQAL